MKIILAFDSFKGSLTAEEAVAAARDGVLAAHPDAEVVELPLADGGEGTAQALTGFVDAEWRTCTVSDALFRPIEARYAVSPDGQTAMMEMASSAGLTLLSEDERNPMRTTTLGVGEMILDAVAHGCTRILIGIGGSATNDGGMGMLSALGVRFLDERGKELKPVGGSLSSIACVDWKCQKDLCGVTIDVICDVQNPLYGPNGAAFVYAPQKGACAEEVELLDNGLRHFANLCKLNSTTPGSGAAGGLGYGLLILGAHLRRGIDVILDAANIDEHLSKVDLVITGEGQIDSQTLNGKLPFGILQRAQEHHIPTIALAGRVKDEALLLQAGFHSVHSINPSDMSLAEAMQRETAKRNMRAAVSNCLKPHGEDKNIAMKIRAIV